MLRLGIPYEPDGRRAIDLLPYIAESIGWVILRSSARGAVC